MKPISSNMIASDRDRTAEIFPGKQDVQKKELRKIDWLIFKRLVVFLYYNNNVQRTNLATSCNMGYDKCILYLEWMKKMDLIKKENDERGNELISLNDKGRQIYEKNFNNLDFN